MDIVVRGRHTEVPERFREYVADKLAKLERLDPRLVRIDVELCHESKPRLAEVRERVELTCRSRGPAIRAEAAADDALAALDLATAKLVERLRRAADRRRVHHGNRTPVSVAAALSPTTKAAPSAGGAPESEPGGPEESSAGLITDRLAVDGDGPLVVREKVHVSDPMTLDQALHEMELVGHDFYLYWDDGTDAPSVVYRRRGYRYGVLRLQR